MAAKAGEVKVLGAWASPFALRVRIALNIKSVDYELVEAMKTRVLFKSNPPHNKIPVLIHADKQVSRSLVIVQYVDEFWTSSGPSILPSDPYDRTIARFWAAYVDDKMFMSLKGIVQAKDEEGKKAACEQVMDMFLLFQGAFLETNKGIGDFFGGDKIGYLDIAFGSFLGWIRVTEKMKGVQILYEEKLPILCKWADKFSSHPAVKHVLPKTDKLLEFAILLFAKIEDQPPSSEN